METESPFGDAALAADLLDDDEAEPVLVDDGTLPPDRFLDRELSWLAFNQRVLELAEDEALPLLERANFLATHPSRVFTREQLLSEVWGYDYFGGTRTVDVHVRRLRAKLGDLESLIGTVRNVGYRFNVYEDEDRLTPVS